MLDWVANASQVQKNCALKRAAEDSSTKAKQLVLSTQSPQFWECACATLELAISQFSLERCYATVKKIENENLLRMVIGIHGDPCSTTTIDVSFDRFRHRITVNALGRFDSRGVFVFGVMEDNDRLVLCLENECFENPQDAAAAILNPILLRYAKTA